MTFVQATPFIFFNTCLTTNTSYTVNFSVTVDTQAPYDARFLTQDLYPQEFDVSFAPASVAGSSTMTFAVTATFRTPNQTTASNSGFIIALEGLSREPVAGGPPFDKTYLGVLAPCIVAADQPEMPGKLPDTGVDSMISLAHLIAYVIVALSLLITGVCLRQRLMLHG